MLLLRDQIFKARKSHRCDYCNGKIEKGIKYHNSVIINDDIYQWKEHFHCRQLTIDLNMFSQCDSLSDEDFSQYINEIHDHYMRNNFYYFTLFHNCSKVSDKAMAVHQYINNVV